jgi:hypothetical protein
VSQEAALFSIHSSLSFESVLKLPLLLLQLLLKAAHSIAALSLSALLLLLQQ